MKRIKILAVAPYPGMKELMNSIAAKRQDIELTVLVGDMQEGLDAAVRALESGDFDIIVSRGGTAELLSRSVSLMTLDITVTPGDILQAVKLAENYKEKFAVVGFSGITGPAAVLCRLLNYGIEVCPVHEGAEVRPLLNRLKIEGCTMVVCDNITSVVAREAGLSAVLVTSGEASIQAAFDQAVKLCRSNSVLRTQNRLYVQALRAVGKSVILDENGGVVFSTLEDTSAALSEFIASASETALRDGECLAEKNIEGMTVRLRAERFAANQENYAVVTVTKEPPLTALREGCVTVLNRNDTLREQFNHYYGTNAGNLRSMVQNYSVYPLPVVIAGEKGTGKNSAANYIYQHGLFSQNQYYVIDCARMTERGWQSLVRNSASPLFTAKTTVYMNDVGALTPQQAEEFFAFCENAGLAKRLKLICSIITNDGDGGDAAELWAKRLGGVVFFLPPLRCRKEDVASLAALYISQLNQELGKQISGFEPEALAMLENFAWPRNLDQFRRVLRELAVTTSDFYIQKESVKNALWKENIEIPSSSSANIDLSGTLDKITNDVVRIVLAQENGNQKRAAERLKIGRSTLWRMLKNDAKE